MNQIRAVQNFIGKSPWDDGPILGQHWGEVAQDLGNPNGVIILDGSDFAKQVKLAPLSRPRNGETKVVDIIHLDWEIENSRRAVGMWES